MIYLFKLFEDSERIDDKIERKSKDHNIRALKLITADFIMRKYWLWL